MTLLPMRCTFSFDLPSEAMTKDTAAIYELSFPHRTKRAEGCYYLTKAPFTHSINGHSKPFLGKQLRFEPHFPVVPVVASQ